MIGLYNKDLSFFEVKSPSATSLKRVITGDVISLTVTEEMGKIETGSIQLLDNTNVYSKILRVGTELVISWGYKQGRIEERLSNITIDTLDQISKPIERRGLKVFVTSPSGSGGQDGKITFNCNFLARDMRGDKQDKVYRTGTKLTVVNEVFTRLGVTLRDIRFTRSDEVIKPETEIRQWESDFRFLCRIAQEWRCYFKISYTPKGTLAGMFLDYGTISLSPFKLWVTGDYKGGYDYEYGFNKQSNVSSFTWSDQAGASGIGDNVQVRIVDGKMQFFRFVTEGDKVIQYRLVPERIKEMLVQKGLEAGFVGQSQLMADWLNVQDFEEIKNFFDPVEAETAPQGIGLKVNIKMLGDVTATAGIPVTFGKGFPDRIGNAATEFYNNRVTHTINSSGYSCDIEVIDAFTISPLGARL